MMVTNVHLHPSSEFRNRSGEIGATNGMGLHQHALFRREPTCFTKKWRKILVDLTDVMEECSCPNLINLFGIQAKFARDLTGILRNSHRMARCVRVSRFNSLYHQFEKFFVDSFDLKVHLVHVTNEEQR